jgi:hypothetical protein
MFLRFLIHLFLPFPSSFLPSYFPLPLLLPPPSTTPLLLATTLRSTEAEGLQRQNGDLYIVRNYSLSQENGELSSELRLVKLSSDLQ